MGGVECLAHALLVGQARQGDDEGNVDVKVVAVLDAEQVKLVHVKKGLVFLDVQI